MAYEVTANLARQFSLWKENCSRHFGQLTGKLSSRDSSASRADKDGEKAAGDGEKAAVDGEKTAMVDG